MTTPKPEAEAVRPLTESITPADTDMAIEEVRRMGLRSEFLSRDGQAIHGALSGLFANVRALRARLVEAEELQERLKLEAQVHAQEARTANATVAEIYQVCTGSTGEPGNWNGAAPVRAMKERLEKAEADRDGAYLERNNLVALLARLYPSGIKKTAIDGWSEDWHGCIYIDLPNGQASWHYHDSHQWLFKGLPQYQGEWDGHTTGAKYSRIVDLCAALDAASGIRK